MHPIRTQSPAAIVADELSRNKKRSRLALSRYTVEAAEQAAESSGDLSLARNVRDVAAIHSTLWPAESGEGILDVAFLVGKITPTTIADESNEPQMIDIESKVSE